MEVIIMVVQHNLTAMNSNRMLGVTTSTQAKSTEKLSSGYKINRAADDAAGLSISEKMRKQIRGLTQASSNAQDGISAVQTAEGALNEVQDMLQRMNELAVKAANGTNSEDDRNYIQDEVNQLIKEIDRVSTTTKFNETYLLKGDDTATFTKPTATTVTFADGDAKGTKAKITLDLSDAKATSGKSDITFSFAGKNYSVRAEENDDKVAIAKKLAQAIKADPIEDEAAGKFTVTDNADGTIDIEAASDKAVKSDKISATAFSVKSSGVLTLNLHVGADSTSDNQISVAGSSDSPASAS